MKMWPCISQELSPLLLLLPSRFSRVRLCATPETAAHQAPPSLGVSRQEHWSGLPFPSPMHQSEKWKWSRSVVSHSSRPHGLQPTRLLHPWDFPGKSTGVGCHCLLLLSPQPKAIKFRELKQIYVCDCVCRRNLSEFSSLLSSFSILINYRGLGHRFYWKHRCKCSYPWLEVKEGCLTFSVLIWVQWLKTFIPTCAMSYWVKTLFCWCRRYFQPSALQGLQVLILIMKNLNLLSSCLKPICPLWGTVCSRW